MFRNSRPDDIPQLRILSELCFQESPEAMDLLYQRRYRPEHCYVAEMGGVPVAFTFALPMTLCFNEETLPAVYLYSVGTHPDWRGRGFSGGLLEYIAKEQRAKGVEILLLVPATSSLFGFYRDEGYETVCGICETTASSFEPAPAALLTPAPPALYHATRERLLRRIPHFCWDVDAVAYQKEVSRLYGGDLFLLNGGDGCAIVERYQHEVAVKELLIDAPALPKAAAAIAARYPGCEIKLRLEASVGASLGMRARPFAMAHSDNFNLIRRMTGSYFSLALD